eukprot:s582_g14.t1
MYFGTGLRYEVDKEEGTVTLSESEDESDDSQTMGSDSEEVREAMIRKSKRAYCLEGFACPRKLMLPVILATLSQVAQWGIAASLGQIGAAMTDPDSCHGSHGKRIYRLSLTSSMIAVPVGSLLSTAVACPRLLFNILSAIQIASAVFIADCALGLFSASADFWKSELGGEVYIVCFALVGGLEGYLLTMAYRYIGDAEDVPGIRRQSASRLLSLLGVLAVNPISFGLGFAIDKGPGNQRKGQAARHCLKIFEEQMERRSWKLLVQAIPEQEPTQLMCGSCKMSMPGLQKLQQQLRKEKLKESSKDREKLSANQSKPKQKPQKAKK